MNITSIQNNVREFIVNNKFIKKCTPDKLSPDLLSKLAAYSVITKDGTNCAIYTYQSLHNEKIPEDKRKFVAAVDFTNGILNVGLQLLCYKSMEKWLSKMFDKNFGKYFGYENALKSIENVYKKAGATLSDKTIQNRIKSEAIDKFAKLEKLQKVSKTGYKIFTSLAIMQILIKRVVTPFVSTPIAGYIKDAAVKREENKKGIKPPTINVGEEMQENNAANEKIASLDEYIKKYKKD